MKPKNKYQTRSHISEKKIRKLVSFFFSTKSCFEISTQIWISPHTVQRYFSIFSKETEYFMERFIKTQEYREKLRKAHGSKGIPWLSIVWKYDPKRIYDSNLLLKFYYFFGKRWSYLKLLEILRSKKDDFEPYFPNFPKSGGPEKLVFPQKCI